MLKALVDPLDPGRYADLPAPSARHAGAPRDPGGVLRGLVELARGERSAWPAASAMSRGWHGVYWAIDSYFPCEFGRLVGYPKFRADRMTLDRRGRAVDRRGDPRRSPPPHCRLRSGGRGRRPGIGDRPGGGAGRSSSRCHPVEGRSLNRLTYTELRTPPTDAVTGRARVAFAGDPRLAGLIPADGVEVPATSFAPRPVSPSASCTHGGSAREAAGREGGGGSPAPAAASAAPSPSAWPTRGATWRWATSTRPGLDATRSGLTSGAEVSVSAVDVSDRRQVEAWADSVVSRHGRVDLLINNAGVGMTAPLAATSAADFDWIMGINFRGVLHGCDAFLPHLRTRPVSHICQRGERVQPLHLSGVRRLLRQQVRRSRLHPGPGPGTGRRPDRGLARAPGWGAHQHRPATPGTRRR